MAMNFDFLGLGNQAGMGADQMVQAKEFTQPGDVMNEPSRLQSFFANPENIRTMGELAKLLDPEGVGGAMGQTAADRTQRTQMAAAGEKAGGQQQNAVQALLQALAGDPTKLVGPPEDTTTANKLTFDSKGIHADLPMPTLGQSIQEREGFTFDSPALESLKQVKAPSNF